MILCVIGMNQKTPTSTIINLFKIHSEYVTYEMSELPLQHRYSENKVLPISGEATGATLYRRRVVNYDIPHVLQECLPEATLFNKYLHFQYRQYFLYVK